jgi:hypothetical protein
MSVFTKTIKSVKEFEWDDFIKAAPQTYYEKHQYFPMFPFIDLNIGTLETDDFNLRAFRLTDNNVEEQLKNYSSFNPGFEFKISDKKEEDPLYSFEKLSQNFLLPNSKIKVTRISSLTDESLSKIKFIFSNVEEEMTLPLLLKGKTYAKPTNPLVGLFSNSGDSKLKLNLFLIFAPIDKNFVEEFMINFDYGNVNISLQDGSEFDKDEFSSFRFKNHDLPEKNFVCFDYSILIKENKEIFYHMIRVHNKTIVRRKSEQYCMTLCSRPNCKEFLPVVLISSKLFKILEFNDYFLSIESPVSKKGFQIALKNRLSKSTFYSFKTNDSHIVLYFVRKSELQTNVIQLNAWDESNLPSKEEAIRVVKMADNAMLSFRTDLLTIDYDNIEATQYFLISENPFLDFKYKSSLNDIKLAKLDFIDYMKVDLATFLKDFKRFVESKPIISIQSELESDYRLFFNHMFVNIVKDSPYIAKQRKHAHIEISEKDLEKFISKHYYLLIYFHTREELYKDLQSKMGPVEILMNEYLRECCLVLKDLSVPCFIKNSNPYIKEFLELSGQYNQDDIQRFSEAIETIIREFRTKEVTPSYPVIQNVSKLLGYLANGGKNGRESDSSVSELDKSINATKSTMMKLFKLNENVEQINKDSWRELMKKFSMIIKLIFKFYGKSTEYENFDLNFLLKPQIYLKEENQNEHYYLLQFIKSYQASADQISNISPENLKIRFFELRSNFSICFPNFIKKLSCIETIAETYAVLSSLITRGLVYQEEEAGKLILLSYPVNTDQFLERLTMPADAEPTKLETVIQSSKTPHICLQLSEDGFSNIFTTEWSNNRQILVEVKSLPRTSISHTSLVTFQNKVSFLPGGCQDQGTKPLNTVVISLSESSFVI